MSENNYIDAMTDEERARQRELERTSVTTVAATSKDGGSPAEGEGT